MPRIDAVDSRLKMAAEFEARAHAVKIVHAGKVSFKRVAERNRLMGLAARTFNAAMMATGLTSRDLADTDGMIAFAEVDDRNVAVAARVSFI